ncbi:potassium voltage-gated channel subfamily C member 3-like [Mytilus trossulus]|uniref:potassium voltage-gated channel subfamily C member 3-like n=1 Tax=Mytilus trossulus TaxID=6551 RepID=UPI003004FE61
MEHHRRHLNFEKIKLNVRGRRFEVISSTLRNIPNTRLSSLDKNSKFYDVARDEYFFDRDPDVFNSIINLYVMGKLHIPKNVCGAVMKEEMTYWKIPHHKVSECCLRTFYQVEEDQGMIEEIKRAYEYTETLQTETSWKIKAWLMFDQPGSSIHAKVWHGFYMVVLIMSAVVYCLWTTPSLRTTLYLSAVTPEDYPFIKSGASLKLKQLILMDPIPTLFALEIFCLLVFTIEWTLHFSFCPQKVNFLKRPLNLINGLLVVCMWISFGLEFAKGHLAANSSTRELYFVCKAVNMMRLVLFLRLERQISTLRVLIMTIKGSMKELCLLLISFGMATMIFSTLIYYAEIHANDGFDSIQICMWWSVITMTTVGYGDYVPSTTIGYLVGVVCAVCGLLLLAMPIAIIASNFSEYYSHQKNRDRYITAIKSEINSSQMNGSGTSVKSNKTIPMNHNCT